MIGKTLALDSNVLSELVNTDEISYVKKKCDFNSQKNSDNSEFHQTHNGIQITFNSFCNSVYQIDSLVNYELFSPTNFKRNFRPIFAETRAYNYKFIPPPKIS